MLEHIRRKILGLIYTRQHITARWDKELTPDVYGKLRLLERKSRHAEVVRCHMYKFEVTLFELRVLVVNINKRSCDCNARELKGIPCVHALACINFIRASVEQYVHPFFTTET